MNTASHNASNPERAIGVGVRCIDRIPGLTRPLDSINVSDLSSEQFWSHYVSATKPVVIRSAANGWRALRYWRDPKYLDELLAKAPNTGSWVKREYNHNVDAKGMPLPDKLPFSQALAELQQAKHTFIFVALINMPRSWDAEFEHVPFLEGHFKKPRVYPESRLYAYRNTGTDWHYHPIDETLTTQISGRKRFSFFRLTADNWNVYAPQIQHNLHHIDFGERHFPPADRLIKYEATLDPGDTVYIPPFWWHGIEHLGGDVGMTVAHCFRSPLDRVADWSEPCIRQAFKKQILFGSRLYLAPFALSFIIASHLARLRSGRPWILQDE